MGVSGRLVGWWNGLSKEEQNENLIHFITTRKDERKLSEIVPSNNTDNRFDFDLADGNIGENLLREVLSGHIEVKRDHWTGTSGNVAVEVLCRGKASGMATTKAEWMGFVLSGRYKDEIVVLIKTDRLRAICSSGKEIKLGGDDGDTTWFILVPKEDLFSHV